MLMCCYYDLWWNVYDKGIYTAERRQRYSNILENVDVTDETIILYGATEPELAYCNIIAIYELLYAKVTYTTDVEKIDKNQKCILINLNSDGM